MSLGGLIECLEKYKDKKEMAYNIQVNFKYPQIEIQEESVQ